MKLYGSIAELVAAVFRKDSNNVTLRPSQTVTYTGATDVQLPPQTTTPQVLVSADSPQTLTNKTISGGSNTISNISLTSQVTGVLPAANGGTGVANSNTLTYGTNNITLTTTGTTSVTLPVSGTLATLSGSETFNNKTIANTSTILIKDANLSIQDDADTTKVAQFQASGITTGTTRTYTFPDFSMTLDGQANTATLSNKTLDNSTVLTIKAANLTVQDGTDTTKQLRFAASGITTATTRTLTAPDANTTIVGTDATQTLTNKTISGSSNTITNVSLTAGVTGTLPIANGGTNGITATAGFDNLSPLTTKGDVVVYNGTHNARQVVGADGTVLSADSTQTTGLKYISVLTNPMTTTGDIIVGGSAGAANRLAIGASGTVLHGGTTPSYSQIVDADVSSSAAIAGTKISPVFTTQDVTTTSGHLYLGSTTTQTNGLASKVFIQATSTTVNMVTLGNSTTGDGFSLLYNPNTGVTTMATNGGSPSSSPFLSASGGTLTLTAGKIAVAANSSISDLALGNATYRYDNSTGNSYFATNGSTPNTTSSFLYSNGSARPFFPNHDTTGSAANAFLDSSTGQLLRSTSSLRYKTAVTDLATAESESVYGLRPITFQSKNAAQGDTTRYLGFVAEEADQVQPLLVQYAGGVPDGFQYDRVVVLLVSEIRKLRDRITALEEVR